RRIAVRPNSIPSVLPAGLYRNPNCDSEFLIGFGHEDFTVPSLIEMLLTRRSAKPALLGEPGPSPEELQQILTAAARVPDHKKLVPWRFIVFEGDARARFGEVL